MDGPSDGLPPSASSCREMAPSNHDRIQKLRHEFQQARQEEDQEEQRHAYAFNQPWVSVCLCDWNLSHCSDSGGKKKKKKYRSKSLRRTAGVSSGASPELLSD